MRLEHCDGKPELLTNLTEANAKLFVAPDPGSIQPSRGERKSSDCTFPKGHFCQSITTSRGKRSCRGQVFESKTSSSAKDQT